MEKFYQYELKEGTIRGMLHLPEHIEPTKICCFFHGFTGNKMDNHFMFVKLARTLCQQGIAVLRFDFLGTGDSDGDFKDMTFKKELAQAKAVVHHVLEWEWVESLYILGFSMGGAIAALTAAHYAEQVEKLVLLAPAGHMSTLANRYLELPAEKILPNGNIDLNGFELGRDFIDELSEMNLFETVERYQGPIKIIHGTNDQAVFIQTSEQYVKTYLQPVEFVKIEGADHCFTSIPWTKKMISETTAFLIK